MQRFNKTLVIAAILVIGLELVGLGQVAPVLAIGPKTSVDSGITWGPSYYGDDTFIEPAMSRNELDFMRQVDRQALTGRRWSPSYAEDILVAPGVALNNSNGVTWGPSYYADDQIIAGKANEVSQDFMRQVDRHALTGVREGPSYDQ